MRKHLLVTIAIVGLLRGIVSAQTAADNTPTIRNPVTIGVLTAAEAKADFDLMRKALEEAHAGVYRYSTSSQMDRVFDAQKARLNRSMKKTEFMAVRTCMARCSCRI